MRFILFLSCFSFCIPIVHCQIRPDLKDTFVVNTWQSNVGSDYWNNWFNYYKIPVGKKVICFFDEHLQYKTFEGSRVSDSIPNAFEWKIYYLDGQIKETYLFDPLLKNDSSITIKTYFKNGELRSESYGGHIHYPKIGKRWEYGYNGKKTLVEEIYHNKKIQYDVFNGDTLSINYIDYSGMFVGIYYTHNQPVYRSNGSKTLQSITYPLDQLNYLFINLDTNIIITHRGVGPVYSNEKSNLVIENNKIDSLEFYRNIKSISISIADKKDLPRLLKKMSVLSTFQNLREIRLIGEGFEDIPQIVFRCKKLQTLELINTHIKNIPKNVKLLKDLTLVQIRNKAKFDYQTTIHNLNNVSNLQTLIMSWDFDAAFPSDLAKLKSLKTFIITNENCISDHWEFDPLKMEYDTVVQKYNSETLRKMNDLVMFNLCQGSSLAKYLIENQIKNPNLYFEFFPVCFSSGTQIQMLGGKTKSIDSIQVNDQILSFNELTQSIDTSIVNQIHIIKVNAPQFVKIKYDNNLLHVQGSISATLEHPFLSNGMWIKAGELKLGQELLIYYNDMLLPVTISELEFIQTNESKLYNLTTSSHTFFANSVVTHNK